MKGGRLERVKLISSFVKPWRASVTPELEGNFPLRGGAEAHEGSLGEGRGRTSRGNPLEGMKTMRAAASGRG